MKKLFLLIFVLIGCGTDEKTQTRSEVPAKNYGKYEMFVDNFLALAQQEGVTIDKKQIDNLKLIGTTEREQIVELGFNKFSLGVCLSQKYNTIYLEKNFSETTKFPLLKWVMFHELGHCILNAEHIEEKNSLMASRVPDDIYFIKDDKIVDDAARDFFKQYLQKKFVKNETTIPLVVR